MRLARIEPPPEGNSLAVAVVPAAKAHLPALTVEEHFVDAYRRLHAPLLVYAEHQVGRDDAYDAVADMWAAVWIRRAELSPEKWNDRYFFGAVYKRVATTLRKNSELDSLDVAEVDLDQRVMSAFHRETREDPKAEVLDAALLVMPHRRREVLLLVDEQGFSYLEAAEILGLNIGTIRTHLRLAKKHLRAAFTRAGYQIAEPRSRKKNKQLPAPKGDHTND